MSDSVVQQLTSEQAADLQRQFRTRDAKGISTVLRGEPAPPLPRCPACQEEAERIDQRVEAPEFGVYETVLRLRWLPCGHQLRAVAGLDAGPVRPDEERDA